MKTHFISLLLILVCVSCDFGIEEKPSVKRFYYLHQEPFDYYFYAKAGSYFIMYHSLNGVWDSVVVSEYNRGFLLSYPKELESVSCSLKSNYLTVQYQEVTPSSGPDRFFSYQSSFVDSGKPVNRFYFMTLSRDRLFEGVQYNDPIIEIGDRGDSEGFISMFYAKHQGLIQINYGNGASFKTVRSRIQ